MFWISCIGEVFVLNFKIGNKNKRLPSVVQNAESLTQCSIILYTRALCIYLESCGRCQAQQTPWSKVKSSSVKSCIHTPLKRSCVTDVSIIYLPHPKVTHCTQVHCITIIWQSAQRRKYAKTHHRNADAVEYEQSISSSLQLSQQPNSVSGPI